MIPVRALGWTAAACFATFVWSMSQQSPAQVCAGWLVGAMGMGLAWAVAATAGDK